MDFRFLSREDSFKRTIDENYYELAMHRVRVRVFCDNESVIISC